MAEQLFAVNRLKQDDNRIEELEDFAAVLLDDSVEAKADTLLAGILGEAVKLGFERSDLAKACEMTEPTIGRWLSRQVKPHPLVAKAAIRAISKLAQDKSQSIRTLRMRVQQ